MTANTKNRASKVFHCKPNQLKTFSTVDPFNTDNKVQGYICKKDGVFNGSLYITHVNDEPIDKPNIIYGTPKLAYPYAGFDDFTWKQFPDKVKQYVLTNKWNGMNVLIFRYYDAHGTPFISAKSKGTAFLHNGAFGLFVNLTFAALGLIDTNTVTSPDAPLRPLPDASSSFDSVSGKVPNDHPALGSVPDISVDLQRNPPSLLKHLAEDSSLQSMTCELCGEKEPHLVAYDFDIRLVPIFTTDTKGRIQPVLDPGVADAKAVGPLKWDRDEVIEQCQRFQAEDLRLNEEFRKDRGLSHRYEYSHFATEGRVLYPLDADGYLVDRTMYKVKPRDIEEVHWGTWDENLTARVDEAVDKMLQRDRERTEEALREELDMGPKEWSRYGNDVLFHVKYVRRVPGFAPETDNRMVVLVFALDDSITDRDLSAIGQKIAGKVPKLKRVFIGEGVKKESALQRLMQQHLRALRSVVVTSHSDTPEQREQFLTVTQKLGLDASRIVRIGVGDASHATEDLTTIISDITDTEGLENAKKIVRQKGK